MTRVPLDTTDLRVLATTLGDTPWTVVTNHYLLRGLGKAYIEGTPLSFTTAVVQRSFRPDVLWISGTDPEAMWNVVQGVPGWRAVNVDEAYAAPLASIMERESGGTVKRSFILRYVLNEPPVPHSHPLVRLLTLDDLPAVESAPPQLQQGRGFGGPEGLLREGVMAGAFDVGNLVATAHTGALTERHADVGVITLEQYRNRGISTAAASLVCRAIRDRGRIPVWSTNEDNGASQRVAEKLGFVPIGRRVNLMPEAAS